MLYNYTQTLKTGQLRCFESTSNYSPFILFLKLQQLPTHHRSFQASKERLELKKINYCTVFNFFLTITAQVWTFDVLYTCLFIRAGLGGEGSLGEEREWSGKKKGKKREKEGGQTKKWCTWTLRLGSLARFGRCWQSACGKPKKKIVLYLNDRDLHKL